MDHHLQQMLSGIADAAFRKTVAAQRADAFARLGTVYLESGVVDNIMQVPTDAPASYSAQRGNYMFPEPVSLFSFSHAALIPLRKVSRMDESGHMRARSSEEILEYERQKQAMDAMEKHLDALKAEGCAMVYDYMHHAPARTRDEGYVSQLCLFVPQLRVEQDGEGRAFLQPNTAEQVKFVSYLARQGFISLEKDAAAIIEATNARVLHLASAPAVGSLAPKR